VPVPAHVICRSARLSRAAAAELQAIAASEQVRAREVFQLAARAELLRRCLEEVQQPVPVALQRAIGALLTAAKEIDRETDQKG
jgi:hypothetical protein